MSKIVDNVKTIEIHIKRYTFLVDFEKFIHVCHLVSYKDKEIFWRWSGKIERAIKWEDYYGTLSFGHHMSVVHMDTQQLWLGVKGI